MIEKPEPRTALVTGGSRGIGKEIAITLAKLDYRVALTYITNRDMALDTVEQIRARGGTAIAIQLSTQHRHSICSALESIRSLWGRISILVNNAAISQEKNFSEITDDDWDIMLNVNLRGAFACSQEVLPDMIAQGWGRIVNMTSIGGQWGGQNQVHYAVSKSGLIGLTRSLARIYSDKGITTNAVAPGLVSTEMSSRELMSAAGRKKVEAIPTKRIATLNEVTSVVAFLISEDASYITGQTINVNGGMYFV